MINISSSFKELSYDDAIAMEGGNVFGAIVLGVGVVAAVTLLVVTAPVSAPLAAATTFSTAVWVAEGAAIGVSIIGVVDALI
jgi:hypothetical protein